MLGMPEPLRRPSAAGSNGKARPRHWDAARIENPLARFVPFSSLVSANDVITRGGDYFRVWRLEGVPFECADEHIVAEPALVSKFNREPPIDRECVEKHAEPVEVSLEVRRKLKEDGSELGSQRGRVLHQELDRTQ